MAAYLLNGSMDQSISPYKYQMRNHNNAHHLFVSMPTYGFTQSNFNSTGLLQLPSKFLSGSYPPPYYLQQPPLLPLPAASARWSTTGRGILCPPGGNRKTNSSNRTRDSSVRTKKPKSPTKTHKKEQTNSDKKSVETLESVNTVPSSSHLELNPKELRKDAVKDLPIMAQGNSMYSNNCVNSDSLRRSFTAQKDQADMFSGSTTMMTISPPPSSLPLPSFCLRPKLRCNAKAKSGIDTGATDDLKRLLRLR